MGVNKYASTFPMASCNKKTCMLRHKAGQVRKEEGKSYWKIPLCDDDATREK